MYSVQCIAYEDLFLECLYTQLYCINWNDCNKPIVVYKTLFIFWLVTVNSEDLVNNSNAIMFLNAR